MNLNFNAQNNQKVVSENAMYGRLEKFFLKSLWQT